MKQQILVVDDEAPVREMLAMYLEKNGYGVTVAADSATALSTVSENRPDLVLCDIDIGGDDGLDLLVRLREAQPDLPVLMMTGMGYDDELMGEALKKQASGYVSKTLPLPGILTEVRRILKFTTGE